MKEIILLNPNSAGLLNVALVRGGTLCQEISDLHPDPFLDASVRDH